MGYSPQSCKELDMTEATWHIQICDELHSDYYTQCAIGLLHAFSLKKKKTTNIYLFVWLRWVLSCGLWDLSYLIRDPTQAPCTRSEES